MLILAGISIAMLTGENGILTQASKAKTVTSKAEVEEQIKLAVMAAKTNVDYEMDLETLAKELKSNLGTDVDIYSQDGDIEIQEGTEAPLPWKVTAKGFTFIIEEDGSVVHLGLCQD